MTYIRIHHSFSCLSLEMTQTPEVILMSTHVWNLNEVTQLPRRVISKQFTHTHLFFFEKAIYISCLDMSQFSINKTGKTRQSSWFTTGSQRSLEWLQIERKKKDITRLSRVTNNGSTTHYGQFWKMLITNYEPFAL